MSRPWGAMNKGGIGTMNIHMTCRFYSSLCGVARIGNLKGNKQSINPSVLLSLRNSDQGVPTKTRYPSKAHSIFPGPKSFSQPFITNHGDLDPLSALQTKHGAPSRSPPLSAEPALPQEQLSPCSSDPHYLTDNEEQGKDNREEHSFHSPEG